MITPDFSEILAYALRSQLAYAMTEPGWDIAQQVGWCQPTSRQLSIHNVPASEVNVIVEIDATIPYQWITVRGSTNLKNWLLNCDYIQHSLTRTNAAGETVSITLHKGFYQAAHTIYPIILPHLNPAYPTRITGHSLGGAIAAILMMFLYEHNYKLEKGITFGQPKVTNKSGAILCDILPLLRIINEDDIVPSLPPDTLVGEVKGGYQHFAPQIIIKPGSYVYHAQPIDHQAADSFWTHLLKATNSNIGELSDNIKDHYIQNYLLNILSNLSTPDPALKELFQTCS